MSSAREARRMHEAISAMYRDGDLTKARRDDDIVASITPICDRAQVNICIGVDVVHSGGDRASRVGGGDCPLEFVWSNKYAHNVMISPQERRFVDGPRHTHSGDGS